MMSMSMMIAMGMVFMRTVMMIVMIMIPVPVVMHAGVTPTIIIRPGNQTFEFAAVEPDAATRLADIYGDPVAFTFL